MKMIMKLRNAFKRKNGRALKRLSNQAIERAAMIEDPDLVTISLISYALYKLLSKQHILKSKEWGAFVEDVDHDLEEAMHLKSKGKPIRGILINDILEDISEIDESLGNYAQDIIEKARIKQASRIYAMGLSMDKAIALTGAERFQLLQYVGSTVIHDRPYTHTKSIFDRFQKTKEILGDKK